MIITPSHKWVPGQFLTVTASTDLLYPLLGRVHFFQKRPIDGLYLPLWWNFSLQLSSLSSIVERKKKNRSYCLCVQSSLCSLAYITHRQCAYLQSLFILTLYSVGSYQTVILFNILHNRWYHPVHKYSYLSKLSLKKQLCRVPSNLNLPI